jgi:serine/threonine protein kinase
LLASFFFNPVKPLDKFIMSFIPGETLLGKYKIVKWLGQGPFSDAYQVEHITQRMARTLKILRKSPSNLGSSNMEDIQDRFQMELTLRKRLNSSRFQAHFIQVFDFHLSGDLIALEREYAPSGSLAEFLRVSEGSGTQLPLATVLNLALDVAEGLAILHTHNMVYLNLKPSNVLFDASKTPKLSDLYLARDSTESLSGSSVPRTIYLGKSSYQSPEMKNPKHNITPPSDIYSLGLILFELLTGNKYTELKPNSSLQDLRPDIPIWLNELAYRMLAHDPQNRPWDGAVVAARLRADLESFPDEPQLGVGKVIGEENLVRSITELSLSNSPPSNESREDNDLLKTPISIPKVSSTKARVPAWKLLLQMLAAILRQPAFVALLAVLLVIACWVLYEILMVK